MTWDLHIRDVRAETLMAASLDAYDTDNARDPRLVRLREQIRIEWQDSWPQTLSELDLELTDGRRVGAFMVAGQTSVIPLDGALARGLRFARPAAKLREHDAQEDTGQKPRYAHQLQDGECIQRQ